MRHGTRARSAEASQAIAARHGIDPSRCLWAQQHPAAIDRGVFHNDVISVGNGRFLLVHEHAFVDQARVIDDVDRALDGALHVVTVPESEVSVADAVRTYLFNSQVVTLPAGGMALILPTEAEQHPGVSRLVESMVSDARCPVKSAIYLDVRESMRNGGGPACLRLRVPLTREELAAVAPGCLWSPDRHEALVRWVRAHYREELAPQDLADPQLLREGRDALDELTRILGLGAIYGFQR